MEKGVDEFIRLVTASHNAILNDATKRVANSLVTKSPRDTGEYLGHWSAEVNRQPGSRIGKLETKPATRKRLRDEFDFGDLEMGDTVFFANDDAAAGILEFGFSSQAPAGVMRITARRWRKFVRGAAIAQTKRIRKTVTG